MALRRGRAISTCSLAPFVSSARSRRSPASPSQRKRRSRAPDACCPAPNPIPFRALMLPREVIRQVRRLQLRARRAVEDLLGGEYRSVFKGTGIAFEEVREYQPGDDIRTIDWNVT